MPKKYSSDDFLKSANHLHNNKYDYSKMVYKTNKIKIEIICPVHGVFSQAPGNHLQGRGCPKCAGRIESTKELIEEFNQTHNNVYDYSKVVYTKKSDKVIIICKLHGEFLQEAAEHIRGCKCPTCAQIASNLSKIKSTEEYLQECDIKHDGKYNYDKVIYTHSKVKIPIICPEHGEFWQQAGTHLFGQGCPSCAKPGFDQTKPGYLYYLKITTEDNQILYKIGITNRTVEARFSLTDLSKIEIIKQKLYSKGKDALDWETKLKRKYKEYQYKGPNVLESGNTELFTEDIIAMWENN